MKNIFIVFILLFMLKTALAQEPQFRHYTVSNGLAHSTVYYAMQDSKGYMWFCTETGVNRFDGRRFETFTIADGLADNENFKCYEDSKGRIWFLSYNGEFSYFKDTAFFNEEKDPSLKYVSQQGIYFVDVQEDAQGNIWFSKFFRRSPSKYDGHQVSDITLPATDSLASPNRMLVKDREGISVIESRYDLYKINLNTYKQKLILKTDRGGINLIHKQQANPETLYFLSENGIMILKNDSAYPALLNNNLGIRAGPFRIIGNDLWIGAVEGLVFIRDFMTKGYTGQKEIFLKGISVSNIFNHTEGGIWVSTLSDGVYYISPSQSHTLHFQSKPIVSIKHNRKTGQWATGNYYGDLVIRSKDNHIVKQFSIPKDLICRIKGIKWLADDKLLVGTNGYVYLYNTKNNTKDVFVRASGYRGANIETGYADMDEGEAGLWIACRYNIYLWNKHLHSRPKLIHGIPSYIKDLTPFPRLISIADDGSKGCWFTSIEKLYRLDLATRIPVAICGRAVFKSNLRDLQYINGYLWIATEGNGIFVFKEGKVYKHIYSKNSKITSDICHKFFYDGKENIWITTNRGITVLNSRTYDYVLSLSSNDVLTNDDIKDIDLYNGKAYIATAGGASVIDIDKLVSSTPPPKVYIKNLLANGKTYNGFVSPEFSYSKGVVVISYTGIDFQSNSSLEYRYYIEGKNEKWNYTDADRVEFYDLSPGTYKLLVSAKKYNSTWSSPAAYTFTVLPLWYQSIWFKILIGIAIAIIILIWINRIRNREKEKTIYNQKIAELKNKALASQMNPHFIFNTLNSLQAFVLQNKPLEANYYIARFSRLIRSIMNYSGTHDISIEQELEFLKLYIELEQLRFEERLDIRMEVDKTISPAMTYIPSLVIQPFVENAIKYGLTEKKEKGLLEIVFKKQDDDYIIVTINDNGIGRKKVAQQQATSPKEFESKGIKYTEERLLLIAGQPNGKKLVNVIDLYNGEYAIGTRVELLIPILND